MTAPAPDAGAVTHQRARDIVAGVLAALDDDNGADFLGVVFSSIGPLTEQEGGQLVLSLALHIVHLLDSASSGELVGLGRVGAFQRFVGD